MKNKAERAEVTPIAASVAPCPCNSGKPFDVCHGKEAAPPVLAPSSQLVRWDLACGQSPAAGFEGVDLYAPNAEHKFDLLKFPWPARDDSVDELHCSHFVEHIDSRSVEARDLYDPNPMTTERWVGQDMLFAFFDEAYRVLKPGGAFKVIVPALQSERAFQDPTHRRFIPGATFMYLSSEWRKANKLDHYRVACDFQGNINHTCFEEMNLLHPEAAARRFREGWNTIIDYHVALVSKKPGPAA